MGDSFFRESLFNLDKRKLRKLCARNDLQPPAVEGHVNKEGRFVVTAFIPCTKLRVTEVHAQYWMGEGLAELELLKRLRRFLMSKKTRDKTPKNQDGNEADDELVSR